MALSAGVQSRLKALADLFATELPERVQGIVQAADLIRSDDDPDAYAELRMRSHKLAGSAATFGFVSITSSARQIEHLAEQALSAERSFIESEVSEVARLVTELTASAEHRSGASQAVPASQESRGEGTTSPDDGARAKRVLACASGETVALLQEYLGMLGLTVERFDRPEGTLAGASRDAIACLVELPPGAAGLLSIAELQSAGVPESVPFYVLAPEDSTKLRLQVTRIPSARFFPTPYPLESIANEIHARFDAPQQSAIVVAGTSGPIMKHVCSIANELDYAVSSVDTIESMMSEMIFTQPDMVVLVGDLTDARRADASRVLAQDPSLPITNVLYVANSADSITSARAFEEGAQQLLSADSSDGLRAYLARRHEPRGEGRRLFRWVLTQVARAQRLDRELSLVVFRIDQLDRLREANQGFLVHRAVRTLASLLSYRLRHSDSLLKNPDLGFTAVLFDASVGVAANVSTEIVASFEQQVADSNTAFSLSVGVAGFPEFDSPLALLDAAKRAADRARSTNGSHVEIEQNP